MAVRQVALTYYNNRVIYFTSMRPQELRHERHQRGWSQDYLARRLSVSQAYVNQLENGKRRLTSTLERKLAGVFDSPVLLPLDEQFRPDQNVSTDQLVNAFAKLGYPGFAYARSRSARKNPGEVLLTALAQEALDPRVAEALPWFPLQYWTLKQDWLVGQARKFNLQNRLGFVVNLARRLSERGQHNPQRTEALATLEQALANSRLAHEDTFGPPQTNVEKNWLRRNRPEEALYWNLLTDMRPEHLNYDAA